MSVRHSLQDASLVSSGGPATGTGKKALRQGGDCGEQLVHTQQLQHIGSSEGAHPAEGQDLLIQLGRAQAVRLSLQLSNHPIQHLQT